MDRAKAPASHKAPIRKPLAAWETVDGSGNHPRGRHVGESGAVRQRAVSDPCGPERAAAWRCGGEGHRVRKAGFGSDPVGQDIPCRQRGGAPCGPCGLKAGDCGASGGRSIARASVCPCFFRPAETIGGAGRRLCTAGAGRGCVRHHEPPGFPSGRHNDRLGSHNASRGRPS